MRTALDHTSEHNTPYVVLVCAPRARFENSSDVVRTHTQGKDICLPELNHGDGGTYCCHSVYNEQREYMQGNGSLLSMLPASASIASPTFQHNQPLIPVHDVANLLDHAELNQVFRTIFFFCGISASTSAAASSSELLDIWMLCPTMAPAALQRGRQLVIFVYFVVFYPRARGPADVFPKSFVSAWIRVPNFESAEQRHQALQPYVSRALGRSVHAL